MSVKTVPQCKTCPWRKGSDTRKIPGYRRELHEKLQGTIREGSDSIGNLRVMACHYAKPGDELPCAGWLHNQIGVGNNIGVRLAMTLGSLPAPRVDGPQHQRFEDTLPKVKTRCRSARRGD